MLLRTGRHTYESVWQPSRLNLDPVPQTQTHTHTHIRGTRQRGPPLCMSWIAQHVVDGNEASPNADFNNVRFAACLIHGKLRAANPMSDKNAIVHVEKIYDLISGLSSGDIGDIWKWKTRHGIKLLRCLRVRRHQIKILSPVSQMSDCCSLQEAREAM